MATRRILIQSVRILFISTISFIASTPLAFGADVVDSESNVKGERVTKTQPANSRVGQASKGKDVLLDRTRREVRMLDDLYKGAIVSITQHYVNDEDAIPAGTAFKALFVAVEKKGWHKVRLIDVSGEPYSDENVAEDEFEKMAVKSLKAGEKNVETIEVREGTRHLRVATPIPVVFEKCIMCHDNYSDVPKGQAIGALSYTVPIDGPLVLKKKAKKE